MVGCGDVTERKSGPAFYKAPGSALVAVMGRRLEAVTDYAARQPLRLQPQSRRRRQALLRGKEYIQWHHVLGMNAHIHGDAQHPAVAEQALKADWDMDQILKRH